MASDTSFADLDTPYTLTNTQIRRFREQGFIKLKEVLSPATLEHFGRHITAEVIRLNTQHKPMEERTTYERAFLQIMDLWRHSEQVKRFVFSRRLARIAAELMGTRGVRLYHDQALYKEPSGGITPWHADQYYWPLSTEKTCTVWAPLQRTPLEMGPLAFAIASQQFEFGRDLEISDESEQRLQEALRQQGFALDEGPFDLGEVSYHYGWTFHRAGPNKSQQCRSVMTIIYMDQDITVSKPVNHYQEDDWRQFLHSAPVGVAPEKNPVLWSAD